MKKKCRVIEVDRENAAIRQQRALMPLIIWKHVELNKSSERMDRFEMLNGLHLYNYLKHSHHFVKNTQHDVVKEANPDIDK